MFRSITVFKALLMSTLLFSSVFANAGQFKQFANLEVHYIALPSTFIQPDVAQKNNIKRSKYNGLLNLAILDNNQDKKAVTAIITGTGRNLLGQTHQLKFTEIKEGKAIYYIAEYPFTNEEIVNFDINIKTEKKSNTLKFQHKFYVD
ncbi:DUF4426 domain-containing protein [Psychromonas sp. RZ22]|uniref:DUF4426 domain-containing protein n=1 Tax=Psychromonas algarum TaxID=2555643 RepID=UPI0010675DA9|nr:DUF4426 domain-containing protein [Psychromonas sp. RZ22]TEW54572.1 DUF4426 domain-containing protein [Psychromonas sp. RZ22]